jgi:hypothetical protein
VSTLQLKSVTRALRFDIHLESTDEATVTAVSCGIASRGESAATARRAFLESRRLNLAKKSDT